MKRVYATSTYATPVCTPLLLEAVKRFGDRCETITSSDLFQSLQDAVALEQQENALIESNYKNKPHLQREKAHDLTAHAAARKKYWHNFCKFSNTTYTEIIKTRHTKYILDDIGAIQTIHAFIENVKMNRKCEHAYLIIDAVGTEVHQTTEFLLDDLHECFTDKFLTKLAKDIYTSGADDDTPLIYQIRVGKKIFFEITSPLLSNINLVYSIQFSSREDEAERVRRFCGTKKESLRDCIAFGN